jgi:hypothetical protein
MDAVKLAGVIVDAEHQEALVTLGSRLEPAAERARAVDVLAPGDQGWVGYHTSSKTILKALEHALAEKAPAENPLQSRVLVIVGVNGLARSIGYAAKERGARIIIARIFESEHGRHGLVGAATDRVPPRRQGAGLRCSSSARPGARAARFASRAFDRTARGPQDAPRANGAVLRRRVRRIFRQD